MEKSKIPWYQLILHQGILTNDILIYKYAGNGTIHDPYRVTFLDNDPGDPLQFKSWIRWTLCLIVGFVTLSVTFASSAYASAVPEITSEMGGSDVVNTLGVSLFVIGFIFGPFLWAPTSELFGRQVIFIISSFVHAAFNVGICVAPNMPSILVLRYLSGASGAAPLTNAGGVIADCFPPSERGLAMTVFALVPLFGPVLGPVVGGFAAESIGWRWLMGIIAILSGIAAIIITVTLPETYRPVLLRRRAVRLSTATGKVYISSMDNTTTSSESFGRKLWTTLSRPWVLMIHEPIIVILALYQAVVFGTLYLCFAAFPIVFAQQRGWPQGISGLPFLGVLVGTLCAVVLQLLENRRYIKILAHHAPNPAPPETRLLSCCIGSVAIPIGLFWFSWTNSPDFHWMASISAGAPFGFGVVLITIGSINYLVDSYTMFAASALAVCVVGRAIFGAVFPLFTTPMYNRLGIHWASMIPAFLALACAPFPYIFYCYGPGIRKRCKYATRG